MIWAIRQKSSGEIILQMNIPLRLAKRQSLEQFGYSSNDYEITTSSQSYPLKNNISIPFSTTEGIPFITDEEIIKYKIAMISSWDITCGIAEYTRTLLNWTEDAEIIPIPEFAKFPFEKYDIIHVQYEPGLFFDLKMILWKLAMKWNNAGKKIIFTIHYYDDFFAEVLSKYCDKIIVHNIQYTGKPNHVYLIQGCPVFDEIPQQKAREKLNLPIDAKILTSFGFIMRWKQLDYVFEYLFPMIAQRKDIFIQLLHSYHNRDTEEGTRVEKAIQKIISENGVADRVFASHDFLSKEEINLRLQASDLGFLWKGKAKSRGSSAVSKEYIAGRCPVVACKISHYFDLFRGVKFVSENIDIKSFCSMIIDTLYSDELSKYRQEQINNYKDLNYEVIGRWHEELYARLMEA